MIQYLREFHIFQFDGREDLESKGLLGRRADVWCPQSDTQRKEQGEFQVFEEEFSRQVNYVQMWILQASQLYLDMVAMVSM